VKHLSVRKARARVSAHALARETKQKTAKKK
jgi:hypothetical protein